MPEMRLEFLEWLLEWVVVFADADMVVHPSFPLLVDDRSYPIYKRPLA